MRRRDLLLGFSASAAVAIWRPAAGSENPRTVIAWLSSGQPNASVEIFAQALAEHGYSELQDYVLEKRFAEGRIERLDELAQELVRLNPKLIVALPTSAGLAAKRATSTIPIVVPIALDALRVGLVNSLVRPGANLTGITLMSGDVIGKRIQLLREAIPGLKRLGMLSVSGVPQATLPFVEATQAAAQRLGIDLLVTEIASGLELDRAFAEFAGAGSEALYVLESMALDVHRERILRLAAASRLPIISAVKSYAHAGALFSYGADVRELYGRAAALAAKILRGAWPGDLPMEQPTKFELVINLKAARSLGLEISSKLLALADEVIE